MEKIDKAEIVKQMLKGKFNIDNVVRPITDMVVIGGDDYLSIAKRRNLTPDEIEKFEKRRNKEIKKARIWSLPLPISLPK